MGIFDEIDITTADISVTMQCPVGPIERGGFTPAGGPWVPEAGMQRVGNLSHFGIDATGHAYFQMPAADPNEQADLLVDPDNGTIWLEV